MPSRIRSVLLCKRCQTGYHVLLLLAVLVCSSCGKKREHPVSFYHWKTTFSLTPAEQACFRELGCKKLYLRFFDVDNESGRPLPQAIIQPFDASLIATEYIPVVFVTNRTLRGLSKEEIRKLAEQTDGLITEIEEKNGLPPGKEIQIDCDWTESTRENYFRFLTLLRENSGRDITCTLRLHQIKFYQKTGIPPVSKGYLMCYATSDPSENTTPNSILDIGLLKDYTSGIRQYPLDLDVALPLYSWAVVTNHLGKIRLINGVTEQDMDTPDFIHLSANRYEAATDLFFRGLYINRGFTIRLESISPELLRQARSCLDARIKKEYGIVYYHLDEPFLNTFPIEALR